MTGRSYLVLDLCRAALAAALPQDLPVPHGKRNQGRGQESGVRSRENHQAPSTVSTTSNEVLRTHTPFRQPAPQGPIDLSQLLVPTSHARWPTAARVGHGAR